MKRSHTTPPVVEEILKFNRDRKPELVRLKLQRMAKDSFAFFRGTDHLFASHWHRLRPPEVGPGILICGDLHLENFGAYRTDDGEYLYDINDFDEALVGPCSLDLVRFTTSIFLAAQLWKFTPVQAMRTVLTFLDRYQATVVKSVRTGHVGEMALGTARGPIWGLLDRPVRGDQVKFLDRFTEVDKSGERRIIRKPQRFRNISERREEQIREALKEHGKNKHVPEAYDVVDATFRVAGIGSLGVRRYAVLVRGKGSPDHNWLLDLKQSRTSALLHCSKDPQPHDNASATQRVVLAQRQLQARPTAGLGVVEVNGHQYRIRELIPEENRTALSELRKRPRKLRRAVAVAGRLTGWAHVRGCRINGEDRSEELKRWAAGPGLDSVIASAVRFAEVTRRDYKAYMQAAPYKDYGRNDEH